LLAQETLVMGMFAYRPKAVLQERFAPLADYLSSKLGDARVELQVLDLDEIEQALLANRLDLLFTNPSHYIQLRHHNRLTGALATLVRQERGVAVSALGGVILTQANGPLREMRDLRGRRVGIAGSRYLGGYQTQIFELRQQGLDLTRQAHLITLGSHDAVIRALLAGTVEAGFVRTGVVEQMQAEGLLPAGRLRLLNGQNSPGFPYWLSTRLYPEWPMLALPRLDERHGRLIASALLGLAPEHPAAQAAGLAGFNVPADYLPVEQLARDLRMPPFDGPRQVSLTDLWQQHSYSILGLLMALALILLLLAQLFRRNRQLGQLLLERVQAGRELRLAASVFDNAREGIVITDAEVCIVKVNDAFCRATGYSREELLGRNPRLLRSGRQDDAFYQELWTRLERDGYWSGEIWNRHKDGGLVAEMLTISRISNSQGRPRHYLGLYSDITALKEHEQRLERIAHYDALTGLPNRVLLADRLQQNMNNARRHRRPLALVYMDLDGFKPVNDSHGHHVGDQLLQKVAQSLQQELRAGDTIARLGGDEFIAVISEINREEEQALFNRLLQAASRSHLCGGLELRVSASLGVSFYPQDEEVDADQLMRQADQAMYQAKLAGKNRYHLFDTEQDRRVRSQHDDLEALTQALQRQEFCLYYQPKVNLRSGQVFGLEALIRWQHPEQGLLPPHRFLHKLEQHPLMVQLGDWVIQQALAQISQWQGQGLWLEVSVNVAAQQLLQQDFITKLSAALRRQADVEPSQLTLEVLETSALEDLGLISRLIRDCRELGVGVALDDFGTGYSSLAYLKRLPVSQLKIDRLFVGDMLNDPDDFAIIEGILGLATAFRLGVVAEGMEQVEQGTLLLQLGCEKAQGYAIARPMSADAVPGWIAQWRPEPAWSVVQQVRREDQAILYACIEHRAWVEGVARYLKGAASQCPPLDPHRCRFSRWLDNEAQRRLELESELPRLQQVHLRIHALAAELIQGEPSPEALEQGVAQLYRLRDELMALMRQMTGLFGH
jgi:diguanylate cyclase (GGDEF)-like protein/PAS domain S-box-containing protein